MRESEGERGGEEQYELVKLLDDVRATAVFLGCVLASGRCAVCFKVYILQ